jgi:hypothetical protein
MRLLFASLLQQRSATGVALQVVWLADLPDVCPPCCLLSDVEVTDRHNQFYEKFSMRQNIGDILLHCWTLQPHK